MKSYFLFLILTLVEVNSFGQITFEKGYLVDNENRSVDCLIKNYDWQYNPDEIEYKSSDSCIPQKAGTTSIKEFGITGYSKYITVETSIDRSSGDVTNLSTQSNPEWSKEKIFLKVLLEGKASLYVYDDKTIKRFFYSVNESGVHQLIFKVYLKGQDSVLTNYTFRQQLWTEVKCANANNNSVGNILYSENDLKKYFRKYNECNNSPTKEYKVKSHKNPFHLKIVSGFTVTSASFSVTDQSYKNTEFDKEIDYRAGIEFEYELPFNKSKWRVVLESSYQHYSSESENTVGNAKIEYQSLEFPIGIRYYVFINKNYNLFSNAYLVVNSGMNFNSAINFDYLGAKPLIIETQSCLAFGIGANYRKLSAEIRINSNRNLMSRYTFGSEYHVSSFTLGYRIF